MGTSVKIEGACVEIALDRAVRLDILLKRLNSCLAAFSLTIVSMLPISAVAQITGSLLPYAVPPSAPQRSEFDPIGLRMGDFFWFPRGELDEAYNSNIFATTTSPTYDLITALT